MELEVEKDGSEVHETPEVAEETTPETPEAEELTPEAIADLRAKAEVSSQNFERAKKAEADLKEAREKLAKANTPENKQEVLSTKDVLYLAKADVHEDDVSEVLEWAKFKKISVADAHKQLTATLQVRAEERKSAETANVSNVRRGPTTVKAETLLENAKSGKLPETDADIARLMDAKLRAK
jgi:hypothetical protein